MAKRNLIPGRRQISQPLLSLRPRDVLALGYLARKDQHENKSLVVRLPIDQRIQAEIGRDREAIIAVET